MDSTLIQVLVTTFGGFFVLGLLAIIGMYYRQQGLRADVTDLKKHHQDDFELVHERITRKDEHYDKRLSDLDKEWEGRWVSIGAMQTDILDRLARIETKQDIMLANGKKGSRKP